MSTTLTPDDMRARLLYRDALMLVIDKPYGLPVHAGPKGGETLDQHFDALTFGLPNKPELAHRLDRETSGCLVLGRHRKALANLGKLFQTGRVSKTYLAVVQGAPPQAEGRVELKLSKRAAKRGWFMKLDEENGREALSLYRVLGQAGDLSLVQLEPCTGRTHQLRVHMAALGCPILGERIYANSPAPPAGPRLHLHAREVRVPLYSRREAVTVQAPLPEHLRGTLHSLGLLERVADAAEPLSRAEGAADPR